MDLIERMKLGDRKAIQEGLVHKGAILRANGIVFAVRNKYSEPETVQKLIELANDDVYLFGHNAGYLVSDFAKAALDIIGIRKYSGGRTEIRNLIKAKLVF